MKSLCELCECRKPHKTKVHKKPSTSCKANQGREREDTHYFCPYFKPKRHMLNKIKTLDDFAKNMYLISLHLHRKIENKFRRKLEMRLV
jgi:hypothetical protein